MKLNICCGNDVMFPLAGNVCIIKYSGNRVIMLSEVEKGYFYIANTKLLADFLRPQHYFLQQK